MEREIDLEIFVGTISESSLVEGQFFLVLWRHSGDWYHTHREVVCVVWPI